MPALDVANGPSHGAIANFAGYSQRGGNFPQVGITPVGGERLCAAHDCVELGVAESGVMG